MNVLFFIASPLLYPLSYVLPKSRKIWLFGGWFGKRYADNSKDFFEFCNREKSDIGIRYVWVYKDKGLEKELAQKPIETVYAYSLKGIWMQLRAKVYITCINSSDFIPFFITRRNFFVQLWHGSPLKYIGLDSRKSLTRKTMDKIRFYLIDRYDLITSPSPVVDNIFKSAFNCKNERLMRSGYPRNENLKISSKRKEQIKSSFGLGMKDSLIAYLPTHRFEGKSENPFRKVLQELLLLNDILVDSGIVIIVKPHFYEKDSLSDFNGTSNVRIEYDLEYDLYEFLGATDALITDYSSIMLDYELLGNPIHIYPFDFEEYTSKDRGLYHEFDEIYSLVRNVKKSESLRELLDNLNTEKHKKSPILNEQSTYNMPFGEYSRKIFHELLRRLEN